MIGNREKREGSRRVSPERSAGVSRADLVRIFSAYGREGLNQGAESAGFSFVKDEQKEKKRVKSRRGSEQAREENEDVFEQRRERVLDKAPLMDFWIPVEYEESPEKEEKTFLDRLETVQSFNPDNSGIKGDPTLMPPKTRPLISWSRMWPLLFDSLSLPRVFARVDEREAVRRISSGAALRSIPFKKKVTWVQTAQVILDYNHNLTPMWDDISKLFRSLEKIRGRFGLEVLETESYPEGPYRNRGINCYYKIPEQDSPIFIISDLGYYDSSGKRKNAWIRFGKRLNRSGFKPVALLPCPERMWEIRLTKYFYHVCWDRGGVSPAIYHKNKVQVKSQKYDNRVYKEIEERLLSLISPALAVEPGLLRTLRYQLPMEKSDIGTEISVWNSEKVNTGPLHCELKLGYIKEYRNRFKEEKELKERTVGFIKGYHRHYPIPVQALEERIAGYLGCRGSDYRNYLLEHIKTMEGDGYPYKNGMIDFINRVVPRMCAEMGGGDYELAVCWVQANQKPLLEGKIEKIPHFVSREAIEYVFAERQKPEKWILLQKGELLVLKKTAWLKELQGRDRDLLFAPGSPIASFTMSRRIVTIKSREYRSGRFGDEYAGVFKTPLINESVSPVYVGNLNSVSYTPEDGEDLIFETDYESIRIEKRRKGEVACKIGRDRYGLYEDIRIKGIVQRFRYIPPGRFFMGSPVDEAERDDDETQHEVVLTNGFWLAETACTQELWGAVTGENPSRFKEGKNWRNRPVENMSWNMCKEFLEKVKDFDPKLNLRLPTEAEWEYACRAGTMTPFSFGENITTDQVNYNGEYPYRGGKKGEYRRETVEVKSFSCNNWGLYEMHGNVWEWCEDWYGDYGLEKVVNPTGAGSGVRRVLRGGSWISDGGICRSAYRFRYKPGNRIDFTGFRLARGQKQSDWQQGE